MNPDSDDKEDCLNQNQSYSDPYSDEESYYNTEDPNSSGNKSDYKDARPHYGSENSDPLGDDSNGLALDWLLAENKADDVSQPESKIAPLSSGNELPDLVQSTNGELPSYSAAATTNTAMPPASTYNL